MPQGLASYTVGAVNLYSALGIIEAATETGRPFAEVAAAYFDVGEQLSLNWVGQQINTLPTNSHWEALARESLRDDLDWQQRSLTVGILASKTADETMETALQRWQEEQTIMVGRWQSMLTELKSADALEFSMIAVALRELLDLAQVSRYQPNCSSAE